MLLIVGVGLVGGPLAYMSLPASADAQPTAHLYGAFSSPTPVVASTPTAGLVGGLIDPGDLISDPVGVVSTGVELAAGGDLIGWPVTDHTPSTGFGYRSDPFTHRQRWHDGVDLGQPCGDPAWAALDGTVVNAGWAGGYGNRVVVRHADRNGKSFATTYNHMAKIEVTVGQHVARGAVVGRIGSTGRSTACHMHFEVILDGSYVDPMRFLTGDTSKAGLSRRVGSFMPSGLPSPSTNPQLTPTPTPSTHTPSVSPTPTPTVTTTSPRPTPTRSTTAPPTPTPTTPSPTVTPTPTPTTPGPTTPGATPTTPTPTPTGTAARTSPTPTGTTTPASSTPGATPTGTGTPTATGSGSTPQAATTSASPSTATSTSNAAATPS